MRLIVDPGNAPALLQPVVRSRTQRLQQMLHRAIVGGRLHQVARALRCGASTGLDVGLRVSLVRVLDRQWLVDTPAARRARRGMVFRQIERRLRPLEVALLVPDPDPLVIDRLLDAGAPMTALSLSLAVRNLQRVVAGDQSAPRTGASPRSPGEQWERVEGVVQAMSAKGADWNSIVLAALDRPGARQDGRAWINELRRQANQDVRFGASPPPRMRRLKLE